MTAFPGLWRYATGGHFTVFFQHLPRLYLGKLPTDCLQGSTKAKPRYLYDSGVSFAVLVPER